MTYQKTMFGTDERSFSWNDLVDQKARNTPSGNFSKEDWRREVIAKCITEPPSLEVFLDKIGDNYLRKDNASARKLSIADFQSFLFSDDCPSTETINRSLRTWTEKNKPKFKEDEQDERYSRTIR